MSTSTLPATRTAVEDSVSRLLYPSHPQSVRSWLDGQFVYAISPSLPQRSIRLLRIRRFKNKGGLQHEYIVAELDDGLLGILYVRLDRAMGELLATTKQAVDQAKKPAAQAENRSIRERVSIKNIREPSTHPEPKESQGTFWDLLQSTPLTSLKRHIAVDTVERCSLTELTENTLIGTVFVDKRLSLFELAILSTVVHESRPDYLLASNNCSEYADLIICIIVQYLDIPFEELQPGPSASQSGKYHHMFRSRTATEAEVEELTKKFVEKCHFYEEEVLNNLCP